MTEPDGEGDNGLRLTADMCVGGVSGPGVKPSCLGIASINDETGAQIGDDTVDTSAVANIVVGASTTGGTLGGKIFVLLSELESLSIDDGVGAGDK